MATIHYSPNNYFPTELESVFDYDMEVIDQGTINTLLYIRELLIRGVEIKTRSFLPIRLLSYMAKTGDCEGMELEVREYTPRGINIVQMDTRGELIQPLYDRHYYGFNLLFSDETNLETLLNSEIGG